MFPFSCLFISVSEVPYFLNHPAELLFLVSTCYLQSYMIFETVGADLVYLLSLPIWFRFLVMESHPELSVNGCKNMLLSNY